MMAIPKTCNPSQLVCSSLVGEEHFAPLRDQCGLAGFQADPTRVPIGVMVATVENYGLGHGCRVLSRDVETEIDEINQATRAAIPRGLLADIQCHWLIRVARFDKMVAKTGFNYGRMSADVG
jgi:hypothetical protein